MTSEAAVEMIRDGLFLILKCALPVLLVSTVIGLIVSILQTITSIQEQTLTFVPKVICVFIVIMITGNWMMTELTGFISLIWSDFSKYVR